MYKSTVIERESVIPITRTFSKTLQVSDYNPEFISVTLTSEVPASSSYKRIAVESSMLFYQCVSQVLSEFVAMGLVDEALLKTRLRELKKIVIERTQEYLTEIQSNSSGLLPSEVELDYTVTDALDFLNLTVTDEYKLAKKG